MHAKPHPESLLAAASCLAVAPGHMAYVGDTHFDMRAANAAGCPCLGVTLGYGARADLEAHAPAAVFDDLASVTDWILARVNPVPA
jgi:phosphoglycolate phosphatase-like HAD superfamily hydrolase